MEGTTGLALDQRYVDWDKAEDDAELDEEDILLSRTELSQALLPKDVGKDHCHHQQRKSPVFPTGSSVPFPYDPPYPQQIDLMDSLLSALKEKFERREEGSSRASILLLESPTGTGKSLSLACSSLAWLRYMEKIDLDDQQPQQGFKVELEKSQSKNINSTHKTGLDWLDDWLPPEHQRAQEESEETKKTARLSRMELTQKLTDLQAKLRTTDTAAPTRRLAQRKKVLLSAMAAQRKRQKPNKRKREIIANPQTKVVENDFCLDPYRSDGEDESTASLEPATRPVLQLSNAGRLLDGALLDGSARRQSPSAIKPRVTLPPTDESFDATIGRVNPGSGVRKIIYAARTHSQLSQFVGEVRRTAWGESVRVIALGSRKTLCGNSEVAKLSASSLTDACLDLQKSSSCSCPLNNNREAVDTLALHTLAAPTDIEEAAELGKATKACAYYASRTALAAAEVVVLPYSLLLDASARASLGLSLHGNLVIVDEAHNLPEALRSLHSCSLSLDVAQAALDQLSAYIAKYGTILAGRNIHHLGQVRKILLAIKKHLKSPDKTTDNRLLYCEELLIGLRIGNINLYKVLRYLKRSRLSQKLLGFRNATIAIERDAIRQSNSLGERAGELSRHVSPMAVVEAFLEKLSLTDRQGMILTSRPRQDLDDRKLQRNETQSCLRYVLLDPSGFLGDLVTEGYAVALVGGTLRPFVHLAAELLNDNKIVQAAVAADETMRQSQKACNKISYSWSRPGFTFFSCDHTVPSSHVLLQVISHGPCGQVLDFRHQSRNTPLVCNELGQTVLRLCRIVPNGVVVFLPSYSYEAALARVVSDETRTSCFVTLRVSQKGRLLETVEEDRPMERPPQAKEDIQRTKELESN